MLPELGKDTEFWDTFKEGRAHFKMILIKTVFLGERFVVCY